MCKEMTGQKQPQMMKTRPGCLFPRGMDENISSRGEEKRDMLIIVTDHTSISFLSFFLSKILQRKRKKRRNQTNKNTEYIFSSCCARRKGTRGKKGCHVLTSLHPPKLPQAAKTSSLTEHLALAATPPIFSAVFLANPKPTLSPLRSHT